MDIDIKFLDKISFPEDKQLFKIVLSLTFNRSANNHKIAEHKALSHEEKVKITKIYEFLQKAGFAYKRSGDLGFEGLMAALEKFPEKNFILDYVRQVQFDKTLNNYRLIKMTGNELSRKTLSYGLQDQSTTIFEFTKLEWKIEIILSNIVMRKVLRPIVILVLHSKQGRKSFYVEIAQFQELRKNFALMLRQIHQIELRNSQI